MWFQERNLYGLENKQKETEGYAGRYDEPGTVSGGAIFKPACLKSNKQAILKHSLQMAHHDLTRLTESRIQTLFSVQNCICIKVFPCAWSAFIDKTFSMTFRSRAITPLSKHFEMAITTCRKMDMDEQRMQNSFVPLLEVLLSKHETRTGLQEQRASQFCRR